MLIIILTLKRLKRSEFNDKPEADLVWTLVAKQFKSAPLERDGVSAFLALIV